jgi:hypothetical protein
MPPCSPTVPAEDEFVGISQGRTASRVRVRVLLLRVERGGARPGRSLRVIRISRRRVLARPPVQPVRRAIGPSMSTSTWPSCCSPCASSAARELCGYASVVLSGGPTVRRRRRARIEMHPLGVGDGHGVVPFAVPVKALSVIWIDSPPELLCGRHRAESACRLQDFVVQAPQVLGETGRCRGKTISAPAPSSGWHLAERSSGRGFPRNPGRVRLERIVNTFVDGNRRSDSQGINQSSWTGSRSVTVPRAIASPGS